VVLIIRSCACSEVLDSAASAVVWAANASIHNNGSRSDGGGHGDAEERGRRLSVIVRDTGLGGFLTEW
jgi:hypothetical protein